MTADATIDTGAPAPSDVGTTTEAPAFAVPEAYADKGYAANIKSHDDLWSQFDNAQSMIGKKSIPGADATDEQVQEFYKQIRPQTSEGYELALPEGIEMEINQDSQNAYKDFFHANGFSPRQAQALFAFHAEQTKAQNDAHTAAQPTQETLDADFDKILSEKYGSKEAGDEAVKITLQHALEHSEETKNALADLPNNQLMAVVDLVNAMHGKLPSKQEEGAPEGGDPATGSQSINDKVKEANKLRMSKEIKDPFHPEQASMRAKLKVLDEEIKKAHN